MTADLERPHVAESRERMQASFLVSSHEGMDPIHEVSVLTTQSPPIPSHWVLRFQHVGFGEDPNIQSITGQVVTRIPFRSGREQLHKKGSPPDKPQIGQISGCHNKWNRGSANYLQEAL